MWESPDRCLQEFRAEQRAEEVFAAICWSCCVALHNCICRLCTICTRVVTATLSSPWARMRSAVPSPRALYVRCLAPHCFQCAYFVLRAGGDGNATDGRTADASAVAVAHVGATPEWTAGVSGSGPPPRRVLSLLCIRQAPIPLGLNGRAVTALSSELIALCRFLLIAQPVATEAKSEDLAPAAAAHTSSIGALARDRRDGWSRAMRAVLSGALTTVGTGAADILGALSVLGGFVEQLRPGATVRVSVGDSSSSTRLLGTVLTPATGAREVLVGLRGTSSAPR